MAAPAPVFRVYEAAPELRPYVCGYMTLTREGPQPARTTMGTLPGGVQESRFSESDPLLTAMPPSPWQCISFNFGDPWTIHKRTGRTMPPSAAWVTGATTETARFDLPRRPRTFDVLLRPGVASVFLRAPADVLTDKVVALDEFWGPASRALTAQIAESRTVHDQIRLLEQELLRRVRAARWIDVGMQRITRFIESEQGAVSVKSLSEMSGLSRQHLARKFREQVGVTPKQFCRYTRFHALLTRVVFHPRSEWAALAAEFGYYDQAHLIAEFKEFTGMTPAEFNAPRLPVLSPAEIAAD